MCFEDFKMIFFSGAWQLTVMLEYWVIFLLKWFTGSDFYYRESMILLCLRDHNKILQKTCTPEPDFCFQPYFLRLCNIDIFSINICEQCLKFITIEISLEKLFLTYGETSLQWTPTILQNSVCYREVPAT